MKNCQPCGVEIPQDYNNLLCDTCYKRIEEENLLKKEEEKSPETLEQAEVITPVDNSLKDPDYRTNPQAEDKPQYLANLNMFISSGILLWKAQKNMYTYIKDFCVSQILEHPQYPKFIWKPKIVDVGCGIGVGSNIMSQEADFVWGIDKNLKSIQFAQQAFTRQKNGIYYNSQVSFDHMDFMLDTREFMQFDIVVAIEIIEHIEDHGTFLLNMIAKFSKRDKHGNYNLEEPTEFFISTPNRNNKALSQERPKNTFHVKEWRSGEFLEVLGNYFNNIELIDPTCKPVPLNEYQTTTHTPLLARVSNPKVLVNGQELRAYMDKLRLQNE